MSNPIESNGVADHTSKANSESQTIHPLLENDSKNILPADAAHSAAQHTVGKIFDGSNPFAIVQPTGSSRRGGCDDDAKSKSNYDGYGPIGLGPTPDYQRQADGYYKDVNNPNAIEFQL